MKHLIFIRKYSSLLTINYQKLLKKVLLFVRYNLATKNNLKLAKTWKIYLSISFLPLKRSWVTGRFYMEKVGISQTEIWLLITWLTIKNSLKTFCCVFDIQIGYYEPLLTRARKKKYIDPSYSQLLIGRSWLFKSSYMR